jgi:hypothetical protein
MGMSSLLPAVASGQASVSFADGADALDISNDVDYLQYGDITLSGLVNATDFHILSNDFGRVTSGEAGDFTYGGTVNAEAFHLLAENFGGTDTAETVTMPAADWAAIDDFAAANGLTSSSNVPEPASVGLLTITSAALLRRRRFSI